ncbi:MAG: mechanosensitive ion channel family protein [Bryobacterales bacterium]|nr:mechanosensitive ion channel family protein [Bryobacterales bacterium]
MDTLINLGEEWPPFLANDHLRNLVFSVLLVGTLIVIRTIANRIVTPRLGSAEERRRWLSGSRNTLALLVFLGLAAVWANAIHSFLLSVVALAAAMVIATKELILCLSGSAVRAIGSSYSLGDRIEWGAVRGDVIDISLLTTTLLEVGPGHDFHMPTGRSIIVPNSKLLDTPVFNESKIGRYVVHTLRIPLELSPELDLARAEKAALDSIHEVCREFLEPAHDWMESLEHTHNFIHSPSADPRVYLRVADPRCIEMLLRFPSPIRRQGRTEQEILRHFLQNYLPGAGQLGASLPLVPKPPQPS